ncbi:MAG TPA: VOC family protein [Oligoflexus sp.]|uniref:VOC family protein n=1 Tax=Oligoflexus sp. TaxID=1971216 RepID=UPI002D8014E3|nr:VOC family protein [Oligoflexus sp.]HET9241220.1 VOC family protein [Oligoflexus sp.]
MQKITPFLWFNNNAEEAITFYMSIFKHSKILESSRYGEGMPFPAGTLMTASFQLENQQFLALNGGPMFQFTEAISFLVDVTTQEELDYYWSRLLEGGSKQQCGWLKDKYGLSWQIIPSILGKLMGDKDPVKAGRVMQAMLKMDKFIIKDLQRAYEG